MFYELRYKDQLNGNCCYYLTDLQWKYHFDPKYGYLSGRWVFMDSNEVIEPVSFDRVSGAWPLNDIGLIRLVTDENLKHKLESIFNESKTNKTA